MSKNSQSHDIDSLRNEIQQFPWNIRYHDEYISSLRALQPKPVELLQEARHEKFRYCSLTAKEISEWLEDIHAVSNFNKRHSLKLEFYRTIVREYEVSFLWAQYLEYVLESESILGKGNDDRKFKELIKEALNSIVYDYKESHKVWNVVLRYFTKRFEEGKESFETLLKLYLKRLTYPQYCLDECFSQLSQFISKYDSDNYEEHMIVANKMYSATIKLSRYYDHFEVLLIKDHDNVSLWTEYLVNVNHYSADEIKKITCIFNRALFNSSSEIEKKKEWVSFWLTYVYLLYERRGIESDFLEATLLKFTRFYPNSAVSFAEYIRNCPLYENGYQLFLEMRNMLKKMDLSLSNNYDDWKVLALAMISFEFFIVNTLEEIDFVSTLYEDLLQFFEFAIGNNDIFHAVEKMVITVFVELSDLEQAAELINRMLDTFSDKYDVWLYAYEFKTKKDFNKESIRYLFKSALAYHLSLDWPERLIQEWISFEQIFGSLKTYKEAMLEANKIMSHVNIERSKTQAIDAINKGGAPQKRKVSSEETQAETKRNREEFSIKVSNLPASISEEKLRMFFGDCGSPNEIKIFNEQDGTAAIIEWSNEQQVLSSLTKDKKKIDDNAVSVERSQGNTLWVSNFPPSMEHKELEEFFSQVGTVISARFPSLRYNQNRRFCYIEYGSPEVAAAALMKFKGKELLDKLTGKKYTLLVDISKNVLKSSNKQSQPETRQIFVQNLNFHTVTIEVLKKLFEQFGDIEEVTLPLSDQMKDQKKVNNGYGFVMFKSEIAAKNALQLSDSTFEKRRISVSPSFGRKATLSHHSLGARRSGQSPSFAEKEFEEMRTISVHNIPDTVNQEQLRAFLFLKVGSVNNIVLFPEFRLALVEFEKIADAGRASLILQSSQYEGQILKAGSKSDVDDHLKNTSSSTKRQKRMVAETSTSTSLHRKG